MVSLRASAAPPCTGWLKAALTLTASEPSHTGSIRLRPKGVEAVSLPCEAGVAYPSLPTRDALIEDHNPLYVTLGLLQGYAEPEDLFEGLLQPAWAHAVEDAEVHDLGPVPKLLQLPWVQVRAGGLEHL